jgi:ABC-type Mn2+/Zn2+ transport system ATPase subunit
VDAEAQEALAILLDRLHRELRVTILYVSHEFGAIERYVDRLLLVRGGIVFDGPPEALPSAWHDPSHAHARE